jgi:hypothetical protein
MVELVHHLVVAVVEQVLLVQIKILILVVLLVV